MNPEGRPRSVFPGDRYERLEVVEYVRIQRGRSRLICRCSCGTERYEMPAYAWGKYKSCGCYRKDHPGRLSHGGYAGYRHASPTLSTWKAMTDRCTRPKNKRYHRYGGRGIKICKRWRGKSGFQNFLADMGERPPGLTIGRIHNDGDYTPKNCEWQTWEQQRRTMSTSHQLTHDGETLTAREWATRLGLAYSTVLRRLKRGLHLERVLEPPRAA